MAKKLGNYGFCYLPDGTCLGPPHELTPEQHETLARMESKALKSDIESARGVKWRIRTHYRARNTEARGGVPCMFVTEIFPENDYRPVHTQSYPSEEDALAGHERIITLVRAGQLPKLPEGWHPDEQE